MKKFTVKKMVLISILAAISCVLYFVPKFPIPIFPSFLEINFSMLPILICSFVLGPIEGLVIVLLRLIVKIIILNTHTAGVGEVADLIIGGTTVLACGLSYRYLKCRHKDILALVIASLCWIVIGLLSNWLYSVPAYLELYFAGDLAMFVNACKIIPGINDSNYMVMYLFVAVLPFNLLLSIIVCLITYFVHRRIKTLYDTF